VGTVAGGGGDEKGVSPLAHEKSGIPFAKDIDLRNIKNIVTNPSLGLSRSAFL
jgi:hypothetical protein